MAYVEKVQTVIIDEATNQVVAHGAGYSSVRSSKTLSANQQTATPITSPVS